MDDIDALEAGMSDDYEFITAASYNSGTVSNGVTQEDCTSLAWSRSTSRPWARRPSPDAPSCKARRTLARGSSCSTSRLPSAWGSADEAVGQSVHVGNDDYTVVGVIGKSGVMGGQSFVPLSTMQKRMSGTRA